jgi:hypothetical protein
LLPVLATVAAASCANDWSTVAAATEDVLAEAPLLAPDAGKRNGEAPEEDCIPSTCQARLKQPKRLHIMLTGLYADFMSLALNIEALNWA